MSCAAELLFIEELYELWLQCVYKSNEAGQNVIKVKKKKKGWLISSENQNSSWARDSDVQF